MTRVRPGAKPAKTEKPLRKGRYTILGTTTDGVEVLQPTVRPDHTTVARLRKAITRATEKAAAKA